MATQRSVARAKLPRKSGHGSPALFFRWALLVYSSRLGTRSSDLWQPRPHSDPLGPFKGSGTLIGALPISSARRAEEHPSALTGEQASPGMHSPQHILQPVGCQVHGQKVTPSIRIWNDVVSVVGTPLMHVVHTDIAPALG